MCFHHLCPRNRARLRVSSVAIVLFLFAVSSTVIAKTAKLTGIIFTIASDGSQTVWPNTRVTLRNLTSGNEIETVSNADLPLRAIYLLVEPVRIPKLWERGLPLCVYLKLNPQTQLLQTRTCP